MLALDSMHEDLWKTQNAKFNTATTGNGDVGVYREWKMKRKQLLFGANIKPLPYPNIEHVPPMCKLQEQSIFPQELNGHGFLIRGYIGDYARLQ